MEFLNPTFQRIMSIRYQVESGRSLSETIRIETSHQTSSFDRSLLRWWIAIEQGAKVDIAQLFSNKIQRQCVEALARGISGESYLETLRELEQEMTLQMEDTLERHLQKLPVILLMPLLFMIFPSFMILLLGPIFQDLMGSLK